MSEYRRQILQMLSEKKITADEAERLIAAAEGTTVTSSGNGSSWEAKPRPKYLRVQVDSEGNYGGEGPTKVNVRVPMQLLRAGVRLAGLIPAPALQRANSALHAEELAEADFVHCYQTDLPKK